MALVRKDRREVQFKIVYCGAPGGGKTTNLEYIRHRLDPALRGDLISISTEGSRTICFDFLPIHETLIAGYRTRFQLYTVPGQRVLAQTRRSVLSGVDGIVFVVDSIRDRWEANLEAWHGCRQALEENGIHPETVPIVYQYNKRDQPNSLPPEELDERFGVRGPAFLGCAATGYQVFATLDWITGEVLRRFHASLSPEIPDTREEESKRSTANAEGIACV